MCGERPLMRPTHLASLFQKCHIGIVSEPDKHRLRTEPDTKAIDDLSFDQPGQYHDVTCRGGSPVDDGERMLRGETDGTRLVPRARNPTVR